MHNKRSRSSRARRGAPRPADKPPPPPPPAPAQSAPFHRSTPTGEFELLIKPLQRALAEERYEKPTPIQAKTIPPILGGRDLIGTAQTGTGKTAAFTLPILQYLHREERRPKTGRPRTLIVAPTRELAAQIGDSIQTYGRHLSIKHTVIYGGVGQGRQVAALQRRCEIVVATPGRLLDLMGQGHIELSDVEVFVLDEADRMLDMGFIHDIRRIITTLPTRRQTLFFSATMPRDVTNLAQNLVHKPIEVRIDPQTPTLQSIEQKVLFVERQNKVKLLVKLLEGNTIFKAIVFTQMKHVANRVAKKLCDARVDAVAIHGNKSQNARTQALKGFKTDKTRVLVATDIAARGIDVDGITHVINYDLPDQAETYVHRIGRTARAGSDGDAISFCSSEERDYLRDIERLIKKAVPVDDDHPYHSEEARNAKGEAARPKPKQQRGQGSREPSKRSRANPRGPRGKSQSPRAGSRPKSPAGGESGGKAKKRPASRKSDEQRSGPPTGQQRRSKGSGDSGSGRSGPSGGRRRRQR